MIDHPDVGVDRDLRPGRVGFFLWSDDFDVAYARLVDDDAEIVTPPRSESYGRVAVFVDVAGNRWDLLGD